jgi:outer membrane protein assembly factor BamA
VFPEDAVFDFGEHPTFVHTEASITADSRDFPGRPTRGGLYRTATAHYSDREAGVFSFNRYEAEAAQFVPLANSRVVVALHGWLVASDTSEGQLVPFYLQPSLGGHNTLRAYADYRFHDRNLIVVNIESRIAMMTHVDAAVFLDAAMSRTAWAP